MYKLNDNFNNCDENGRVNDPSNNNGDVHVGFVAEDVGVGNSDERNSLSNQFRFVQSSRVLHSNVNKLNFSNICNNNNNDFVVSSKIFEDPGIVQEMKRHRRHFRKIIQNPRQQDDDLTASSKTNTNKTAAMDISGNSKENKKLSSSSSLNSSAEIKNQELLKSTSMFEEARFNGEPSERGSLSNLYHGTWPVDQPDGWQSGPSSLPCSSNHQDITSVMSFASSAGSNSSCDRIDGSVGKHESRNAADIQQQLGAKVDIVYSLLSMLGSSENVDMGHTLFALSSSPESCLAMRKSGCIPLLVQLVHSESCDKLTRRQASQALCNLVQAQPDERLRKRELRVLKLLDQVRAYNETIEHEMQTNEDQIGDIEDGIINVDNEVQPTEIVPANKHLVQIIANIMKLSFDEGYRVAICHLGGLQVIAKLIEMDYLAHRVNYTEMDEEENEQGVLLRRYSGMALTNLTFGDSNNKALLCSLRGFMVALVRQLYSRSEDLKQVTASVLRNLSWRADTQSKQILREVGTVRALAHAALCSKKEATLKSILSALWNLSAHCSINKADICNVELLAFLVKMLSYESPTETLTIVENAGGILRNISSHIAVREDYRVILRQHNCFRVLLDQLRSPSLTVVSNACGTLWNLSAKCTTDQQTLWDMGAVPMLRSLTHSKHKMISMGSSAALKNLLSARPPGSSLTRLDSTARALGLTPLPTLGVRKQRALEQELDENLSETCDNIEPNISPTNEIVSSAIGGFFGRILPSHSYTQGMMMRKNDKSESRESVTSTHSDSIYERVLRTKNFTKNVTKIQQNVTKKLSQSDTLTLNEGKCIKRYEQQRSLDSSLWKDASMSPTTPSHPASASSSFLRTKYSDCMVDDDQVNAEDQPVDYSQKFAEKKEPPPANSSKTKVEVAYGNYAVTDLDQPTNYSLRYAEDDESNKIFNSEFSHEDTIKTYCTEGTPYETPFNFSTATSMNDLRTLEHPKVTNPKISTNSKPNKEQETETLDEKETCSVEDVSKMNEQTNTFKSSHLSSGINSPDKLVNYCEEGTPGYFSRVSSLSSLHSLSATNPVEVSKLSPITSTDAESKEDKKDLDDTSEATNVNKREENRESKVVTFGNAVNYAEETPLMFSRSSSLASLGSVDQHSIHDDRSSIISDFSRRTSGVISPSELPDSPTQTVPPTPFTSDPNGSGGGAIPRCSKRVPARINPKRTTNASVFEDTTSAFKDENTPIEFSRATSLSSLTIDDDVPGQKSNLNQSIDENSPPKIPSAVPRKSLSPRTTGIPRMRFTKSATPAAQIKSGLIESPNKLRNLDNHTNMDAIQMYCTEDTPAVLSHAGSNSNLSELSFITHNDVKESSETQPNENVTLQPLEGSVDKTERSVSEEKKIEVSDKSLVRVKSSMEDEEDVLSDVSSNTSADDRLLQICIQAGVDRVTNTSHRIITPTTLKKTEPKVPIEDEDQIAFSDDSYTSADERLLQQCIQAGMARVALNSTSCLDEVKKTTSKPTPARRTGIPRFSSSSKPPTDADKSSEEEKLVSDDNSADEKVLQDAIQLGMERVNKGLVDARLIHGGDDDDNASITSADERLLNECINCGIQAVTGQRPQIPPSFVQESQVHQHRKLSAPHANADAQKVPKRSRSLNFVQRKTSSQNYTSDDSSQSNLKNKSSNERFVKSDMPQKATRALATRSEHGSTLSLESEASLNDHERILLDQCIRQGIERTTGQDVSIHLIRNQPTDGSVRPENRQPLGAEKEDSRSRQRIQYSRQTSQPAIPSNRIPVYARSTSARSRDDFTSRGSNLNDHEIGINIDSKNVQAPPVTANTVESLPVEPSCNTPTNTHIYHQVTGVEENSESVGNVLPESVEPTSTIQLPIPDTCENTHDNSNLANFATGATKNGSDTDESSSEISDKYDYCKPRDPDSMIASVDRLTAELVSHASHLMKQSAHHDTLTESTSNSVTDLTFPSISASIPLIVSIKSEKELEDKPEDQHNFSSLDTNCSTLTDSTIIANEALKIADVVQNEGAMAQSCGSEQLDHQNPPSEMASLCGSDYEGNSAASNDSRGRIKIKTRKISSNSILRRALNNSSFNGSYDNLPNGTSLNNSFNLDSIKPPSIMNDISDMDNSMLSVCSITSEVVEVPSSTTTNFIPNGLITTNYFDKRNNFLLSHSPDLYSDIEHINPPSYFNHMSLNTITQNSFDLDQNTTCEDSDIFDTAADNTLINEEDDINDDLTTEYTDAQCLTPLQSDTSPEASPKKSPIRTSKRLTPKQRRQLTKERYKTYTVTPEMYYREIGIVHSATYDQLNHASSSGLINASDSGKGSSIDMKDTSDTMSDSSGKPSLDSQDGHERKLGKLTPRQRRQEDKSRFQTQVLDTSMLLLESSVSSGSPKRTLKQKREEDRDRYRTQTIDDHLKGSTSLIQNDNEMMLIQHGANLVMKTLLNSSVHNGDFLDCETLSLVSNEDDDTEYNSVNSEHFRTYHKSWGFSSNSKLPIINTVPDDTTFVIQDSDVTTSAVPLKPKIVKPVLSSATRPSGTDEESSPTASPKAIRGRRKPLYAGGSTPKRIQSAPPATTCNPQKKPPLVVNKSNSTFVKKKIPSRSPQSSPPARTPKVETKKAPSPFSSPLRRQGTFVKEESTVKSKIPQKMPSTRPASSPSRLPVVSVKKPLTKSSSIGESSSNSTYKRSPSETVIKRTEYLRSSSYSANKSSPASKLTPSPQRSYSNSSIQNSRKVKSTNAPSTTQKEITSKIATLWKKIETNRTQTSDLKKDTRVWITSNPQPTATASSSTSKLASTSQLIRSSTFDSTPGKLKQIQT